VGKVAERRKVRRAAFFAQLADRNPERFREELTKRTASWVLEIWKRAGVRDLPSVFSVVDEAKRALAGCNHGPMTHVTEQSIRVLTVEASKAIATAGDRRLYQVTLPLQRRP
jgi:hypothetical protein